MKVKMKIAISGGRAGQDWPPVGGEIDLPDDEAAALVDQGLATPVAEKAADKAEKAVPADDAETRSAPKKRAGRPPKKATD